VASECPEATPSLFIDISLSENKTIYKKMNGCVTKFTAIVMNVEYTGKWGKVADV
jgi:hypothetical protein